MQNKMKKEAKATLNKILDVILLTMKYMHSTWNLFTPPLGYLVVIITEFERSSVTPRWEMKHDCELFGQTVYICNLEVKLF